MEEPDYFCSALVLNKRKSACMTSFSCFLPLLHFPPLNMRLNFFWCAFQVLSVLGSFWLGLFVSLSLVAYSSVGLLLDILICILYTSSVPQWMRKRNKYFCTLCNFFLLQFIERNKSHPSEVITMLLALLATNRGLAKGLSWTGLQTVCQCLDFL